MESEALIGRLAGDLTPVRVMPPPGLQAMLWLAFAIFVIAVAVAVEGFRPDLHARMLLPDEVSQFFASMLARPDRNPAWALLPVAPLVLWLGSLGWGCFADLARMGPAAWTMGTSWGCLKFIVLMGTPLTAAMLLLLRHAGPVRPLPVLLLGGLASAALCSAGLSLFHHLEAALMVLVWHGGALAVVVVLGWRLGRPLLQRPPVVPR